MSAYNPSAFKLPTMNYGAGENTGFLPDTGFMNNAYEENPLALEMNTLSNLPADPNQGGMFSFLGDDPMGTLGKGANLAGSLGKLWLGMKNYGLLKDQLKENKKQFSANFEANRTTTNASLEDRQRARVASGSGYESVGSYMNKNAVRSA